MNRKKIFFLLPALFLAFQQSAQAAHADYENKDFPLSNCDSLTIKQKKTDCYVDYAVSHHFFYWGKFIYGVNGSGPIEDGFAKAYQTSPNEEKIANSYAAAQIRNKHVKEGIALYQENFKKFGDFDSGYNALVYLRALAKTPEERQQATGKLNQQLQQHFPNQTAKYDAILDAADKVLQDTNIIHFDMPKVAHPGRYHAIVVLGYQLDKEGNPQEPLKGIMAQALKVAKEYPDSKIIVTGGVPRNNRVEAEVMWKYFTENGIAPSRIIPEVLSYDTVQNANYTAMIMRNFNIREATIVTRAGHIRRGTVLMNNALKLYVPWQVNLTSMAWKDSNFATEDDAKKPPKLGSGDYRSTYRDVLRLYRQEYPGFAM